MRRHSAANAAMSKGCEATSYSAPQYQGLASTEPTLIPSGPASPCRKSKASAALASAAAPASDPRAASSAKAMNAVTRD